MASTFSLPRISTNVRFAATAVLAPDLAGAWAERLFLTPPRQKYPESGFFDLIDARSSFVEHRGRQIATWRWGAHDAPAVLLAHGWGGRATQMRAFVFHPAGAGFRVIAYDQPAHGLSEGRFTALPDFADAEGMRRVIWQAEFKVQSSGPWVRLASRWAKMTNWIADRRNS